MLLLTLTQNVSPKHNSSPLREEVMYTPQKEVHPDKLPDIQPLMNLHFNDGNTLDAVPFQALGEEEIQ